METENQIETAEAEKATLENLMRARLDDPRAMIGALSINANRVLLTFGDVGPHLRVVLHVTENGVEILHPKSLIGDEETAAGSQAADAEGDDDDMLYGSSVLPSHVEIAEGVAVQLGAVVARAHAESGLTVAAWNALPDDMREAALAATVEDMKAEAAAELVDPEKHTKAELLELAAKAGVEVDSGATKAKIAEALNAPR